VAVNYLGSHDDVLGHRIGCIGLSGGGCRAPLLQATSARLAAAVVVGMMSSYQQLLDHNVASHTWMFFPAGWARYGDWPDLAACRAPTPLLVQYDRDDDLFTVEGMQAAHTRIVAHYQQVGHPECYTGAFYPGPHKFDRPMQAAAFAWLQRWLAAESPAS
jgi:dienelactone hydrolase